MQSTLFQRGIAAVTLATASGMAMASEAASYVGADRSHENLRPGVTQIMNDVHGLHVLILSIVSVIGLLVAGLMIYSMFAHRKSKNPEPAKFHEHLGLEIFWTIVPFVILIFMAYPATKVLVAMDDTSESELVIKVTGYRWNWSYEYLAYGEDNDVGVFYFSNLATPKEQYDTPVLAGGLFPYGTAAENYGKEAPAKDPDYMLAVDKPLVIPAGIKVRFLVTADDVIHSFYMPDFGVKKDGIPGFINETWALVPEDQTGTYYGQCTELCGKGHAFMPIQVNVVAKAEFDQWIADEKEKAASGPDLTPFSSLEKAMDMGKGLYAGKCAICHGGNGEGGVGPAFAGSDLTTNEARRDEHIHVLVAGRNAMPSFKAQLSPKEIAAIVTYERNAFGNDTGDLIQPADVAE